MRPRLPTSKPSGRSYGAEGPLVLASSVALVVLSTAAEVEGGGGVLRGHGSGARRLVAGAVNA